jgi:hypothetical protein
MSTNAVTCGVGYQEFIANTGDPSTTELLVSDTRSNGGGS